MGPDTLENGRTIKNMEMDCLYIQMAQDMKVSPEIFKVLVFLLLSMYLILLLLQENGLMGSDGEKGYIVM